MSNNSWFWRFVYTTYPPILRLLEELHVHNHRQDFLIGYMLKDKKISKLINYLKQQGFEPAILTWRDPGEILNVKKIDKAIFQYHLRLFKDLEFRGHYEYSSEGNPWGHITEKCFEPAREYFQRLLVDYLKK